VITARATRLLRVPDLKGLRAAVAQLTPPSAIAVRRTAVLVPSRSAGEELRRSLESSAVADGAGALFFPDILTRAELYANFHAGLEDAPPMLTPQEREVLLRRASREAIAAGAIPPFRLRAGLVLEMLAFYDELRRREATLDDFERHTVARLSESAGSDRGAERLLRQTEFLLAAYAAFERDTVRTGGIDEHALRALLVQRQPSPRIPYDRVIVTVPDQAADPMGLYASDFVLLTQLGGLAGIDVIATENTLAAGFHERLHGLMPELEEVSFEAVGNSPTMVAPESPDPGVRWFVSRDREEELASFVRRLKWRTRSAHDGVPTPPLDRIGIVFQRPLPYLYLARQVFSDGGVPWQAMDALPLSAEPFAATLDVIFSFLSSEGNRSSAAELLRSPHLSFRETVDAGEVAAFDARLRESKYAGGWDRLESLGPSAPTKPGDAAISAAKAAGWALRRVLDAGTASAQLAELLRFLSTHERLPPADADADWAERHRRARAAILAALEALRDAHAKHDDERLDITELAGAVRRWIDAQTFSPTIGTAGVRLMDAAAARYADLDELYLVGLVERDWPEPSRRSIFYPAGILSNLGWPVDAARMPAARAAFQDLLRSPRARLSVSLFTLEDDSIVAGSPFLEDIESAGLTVERWPEPPPGRVFIHEGIQGSALPRPDSVSPGAAAWAELRATRTLPEDPRFKGMTGPRPAGTYAISYLERYLECPFKYFAGRVLKLPEERDEEAGLTPIERGHLLHGVFETFFREWDKRGQGTITTVNVAAALALFEEIAERRLAALPEADRALERTHLLGSAAASGLAERAFAFEIEQGGQIVERLLEHELEGEFTFAGAGGARRVRIRAKADRLDLMADGTIRVIDYKLGKAPKASRSLQLPIYGVIAQQALAGYRGRDWTVAAAGYVAFKEKEPFVPLGGRAAAFDAAVAEGQQRLLDAIDGIERGEFPVRPDEPFRCQWCAYAGVCRKDYVGDE
jgi:RecB family exonuclease